MKDYYSMLGVSRDAAPDEIKRAYRKLALLYHPDKPTGNEEKFKEINEAYQALGDEQKRAQYDQFGQTFEGAGFGGAGFDPFTIFQQEFAGFEDMFGDLFGFSRAGSRDGAFGRRRTRAADRGDDRATAVTLEFEEMVRGTARDMTLERLRTCPTCAGSGAQPGTAVATCATCGGTGALERQLRTFLGTMIQRSTCPDCRGEGKRPEKPCRSCSGTGRTHQRDTLRVKIPAGIEDGTRLRIAGEGETGLRGGEAGDLYVTVRVNGHATFTRDGNDIRSTVAMPFSTAALGGDVPVETVDGSTTLAVPRGTAPGTEFRLRGRGVPIGRHGRTGRAGDHIVTVVVDVPRRLTREQEELLRQFAATSAKHR